MKKIAIYAATALASTLAFASPAAANNLPPQQRMQAQCNLTKPSDTNNARYTVVVTGGVPTSTGVIELSRVTTQNIPGGTLVSQTPYVLRAGSEGRSGGSPNIHAIFESTATYSGGLLVQDVTEGTIETYNYGCAVTRTNRNGASDQPPGLQTTGLSFTVTTVTNTFVDTVAGPDTTAVLEQERVVCNSPGSKGGQWRAQNGYGGACTTAAYLALGGGVMPRSNSVPTLFVSGKADHNSAVNADNDQVTQLVDTDPQDDTGE